MARVLNVLGGAFGKGAATRAGLTASMDRFAARAMVRARTQVAVTRGLAGGFGTGMAARNLGVSALAGARRGAVMGAGLGAVGAGVGDASNGNLGFGTPFHMMGGAFRGAVNGALFGGMGGAAFGFGTPLSSMRAMRRGMRGF